MPGPAFGIVVFGDVIDSRREPARATAFLRALRTELEGTVPREARLAAVGFTQGDELQLLLAPEGDPFEAVLRAGLRPDAMTMRWAIAAGPIDPGRGPATERTGEAYLAARAALDRAKLRREPLVASTGDPAADGLLADLGSLLPILLADLTARQREVARLVLVEGLRQADVAERLRVSRATISVLADRARVREIGRVARALATVFASGVGRVREASGRAVARSAP